MQLTPKEASLLKDLKGQEQLCVDKYNRHAASANDPQLKNLFEQIAQVEQQHLDAITQMEGGTVAPPADSATVPTTFTATYNNTETPQKQNDCYLCTDVLAMEKHASHLYDTCVFEFCDANARSVLNDIQKQEQHHGKVIYDYMNTNAFGGAAFCLLNLLGESVALSQLPERRERALELAARHAVGQARITGAAEIVARHE